MSQLFTNNASGTLSVTLADEAGPSSVVLQVGEGDLFPAPTGGDFFMVTVEDTAGYFEILKCTARATNTLTCTRAQESTGSRAYATGSKVEIRNTAGTFNSFLQLYGGVMVGELDMDGQILRDPIITNGEARNLTLRGTDGGTGNQLAVPTAGAPPTIGGSEIQTAANLPDIIPPTREIAGDQGIAIDGDLSADRTATLDLSSLNAIPGASIVADDLFLVYDDSTSLHKKIPYRRAGIPIIVDATVNPVPTDDEMNAFWLCSNAATVDFDLDTDIGEKGNVLIVQQGGAGVIDFTNGTATINSAFPGNTTAQLNSVAILVCTAQDVWTLYGDCV